MKNADKIVEGLVNKVKMNYDFLPKNEQDEIIRRRLICASCPFMSSNAVSNPALNYKTDRTDEHCSLCMCNIDLKTASLSANCGIEVYNDEHPDTPMGLKWTEYKTKGNE